MPVTMGMEASRAMFDRLDNFTIATLLSLDAKRFNSNRLE
jgi:hypothetical protein